MIRGKILPVGAVDLARGIDVVLRRLQIVSGNLLRAGRLGLIDRSLSCVDALLRGVAASIVDVGRLVCQRHVRASAKARDVVLQLANREIRAQPLRFGKGGPAGPQRLFRLQPGLLPSPVVPGVPVCLGRLDAELRLVVETSCQRRRAGVLSRCDDLQRLRLEIQLPLGDGFARRLRRQGNRGEHKRACDE
ncbi:MAG TPA: hypothetical protein VIM74_07440 [Casimicrobiaceae bacterium]